MTGLQENKESANNFVSQEIGHQTNIFSYFQELGYFIVLKYVFVWKRRHTASDNIAT
jgi:hypothetical protein